MKSEDKGNQKPKRGDPQPKYKRLANLLNRTAPISRTPIPRTPPGWKRTGNLLYDLNQMYGPETLMDGRTRARLRREYRGKIEIKRIGGEWRLVSKGKTEAQKRLDK